MVSDKMKEKEKVVVKPKTIVSAPTTYSESLQVSSEIVNPNIANADCG